MDKLQVQARAPRAVNRTNRVRIPARAPTLCRLVPQKSQARAETVLRSDAAYGDMNRLSGEQFFRTAKKCLEGKATFLQLVDFAGGIDSLWRRGCGSGLGGLLGARHSCREKCKHQ